MSTQPEVNFYGSEQTNQAATQVRPFVRFPDLKDEAAGLLAKALDFEASAGRAVLHGQASEAEHLRVQGRAAWSKFLLMYRRGAAYRETEGCRA